MSPASSNSRRARTLVNRLTPLPRRRSFGSRNVELRDSQERCSNQIHTIAFRVRVASAACSAHHSGTFANLSFAFLGVRRSIVRLPPGVILRQQLHHLVPDLFAALIEIGIWKFDDVG